MTRKKKKTFIQQSMRKEKLGKMKKSSILFYNKLFKPFKMIINHIFFYFSSSFSMQFLLFNIKGIKERNMERQIARKGKLYINSKNNFNLLVMNVTQLNFLNRQNAHICHFINVSHKRSLLFVVVLRLISWSKTQFFTDYNDKI